MDFKFERTRVDKIPREKIIDELAKVSETYNHTRFTSKEFLRNASIGHQTVFREFVTWDAAMDCLTDYLKQKNITLKPRTKPKRKDAYTQKQIFDEMQRIWSQIGHRPSKIEWEQTNPKINYNTVRRHFNGWTNACLRFIEYITGENNIVENIDASVEKINMDKNRIIYKPEDNRTIPLGTRLKILARDNFRCVYCGKSPSTDIGTKLHIDHIIPFSKGGKSIEENLQTLCLECNFGKSNKRI
ncbi:MAG: HNH endonuclease [Candidatus Levybacteria bacterium]|nr:HNH endonuclease [Candidatus Levybacteria bacterium]